MDVMQKNCYVEKKREQCLYTHLKYGNWDILKKKELSFIIGSKEYSFPYFYQTLPQLPQFVPLFVRHILKFNCSQIQLQSNSVSFKTNRSLSANLFLEHLFLHPGLEFGLGYCLLDIGLDRRKIAGNGLVWLFYLYTLFLKRTGCFKIIVRWTLFI